MKSITGAFATLALTALMMPLTGAQAQTAYVAPTGGNVYASDFFDMTVTLPSNWTLSSKAEADNIMSVGGEELAGDNAELKEMTDLVRQKSLTIMFAFEDPAKTGKNSTGNLSMVAENVSEYPASLGPEDAIANMRALADVSATDVTYGDMITTRLIDGQPFSSVESTVVMEGVEINQIYLIARKGDHLITIIQTHLSEETKFLLDGIISNIKLDWTP